MKLKAKEWIFCLAGVFVTAVCVLLPGQLIKIQADRNKNIVIQSMSSYKYRGNNTVTQMTFYERMKLISGEWDSVYQEVPLSEVKSMEYLSGDIKNTTTSVQNGDLEYTGYCYQDYQSILQKAEDGVQVLYEAGIYPESADSSYNSWYRPRVTLYQFSDSIFDSYSCYVWLVQLDYYDGRFTHTLLIDDTSGRILAGGVRSSFESADAENDVEPYAVSDQFISGIQDTMDQLDNAVMAYYLEKDSQVEEAEADSLERLLQDNGREISKTDIYVPKYHLFQNAYDSSIDDSQENEVCKLYLITTDHAVKDYNEAKEEVRNSVDNDKYIIEAQWYSTEYYFKIVPFTVKLEE